MMEEKGLIVKGQVVSGLGEGRFITELDWVRSQCQSKLGFSPAPGTFNLRVFREELAKLHLLANRRGVKLLPPSHAFAVSKCFTAEVAGIRAAVIRPMLDDYPADLLEIIAPVNLREALNVRDGDAVEVCIMLEADTAPAGQFGEVSKGW